MACPKPGSVSELTMADKPRLSEEDILDEILSAFMGGVYQGVETLDAEGVLRRHSKEG